MVKYYYVNFERILSTSKLNNICKSISISIWLDANNIMSTFKYVKDKRINIFTKRQANGSSTNSTKSFTQLIQLQR